MGTVDLLHKKRNLKFQYVCKKSLEYHQHLILELIYFHE